MAQLQENTSSGNGRKRRATKLSTHLDMTPMVDLAFLLLTFFMLTTTFSKFQTMELFMPVKPTGPDVESPIKPENALTVILGDNNRLYYYFGFAGDTPEVAETDFSAEGIRKVLLSDQVKTNHKMVVLIKAMENSNYGNLVDILDEMKITEAKKYALVEISEADKTLIEDAKGS